MSDIDSSSRALSADPASSVPWAVKVNGDVLALSGTVDFTTATQILESVQSTLKTGGPTVIDLAGVTRINSAGLAVMIEWLSVARREGVELRFDHVPKGLRELANVCQVDDMLPIVS